jgi:ABC-type dipeptide/oligopeptide/nickel transport system permease subunit
MLARSRGIAPAEASVSPPAGIERGGAVRRGRAAGLGRLARQHTLAVIGGLIVVIFVLTGLLAPWIAPADPNRVSIREALAPPGRDHLLGTDNNGRDLLSRLMFGARVSLTISFSAVGLGAVVGVTLGLAAGWYRRLEPVIMRLMDVMLSFPGIIFALAIIAILGNGLANVILAVAVYQVPEFARLAHSMTLSVKASPFVEAIVSVGARDRRILSRYVLPNILSPIIVQVSLLIPAAIMTAASLSFLGLGVTPPTAEWGSMLQNSLSWARMAPHVMLFPGIALMLVVFGFNVLGDGLRDALDPRLRAR